MLEIRIFADSETLQSSIASHGNNLDKVKSVKMVPNISNDSALKKHNDYSNDVVPVSVISSNELDDNKNRLVSFDDALKEIGNFM